MIKRIVSLILCCWIGFFSVFVSYEETVKASDWVENLTNGAGITATVTSILTSAGASPLLIAMLMGGSALVTSGVFVDYITSTPIDQLKTDIKEMGNDIKGLYETWLERGERQRIQAENALLSAEEVASQAITSAKNKAQKFWDNAVNVKGETKDLEKEDFHNWQSFNVEMNNMYIDMYKSYTNDTNKNEYQKWVKESAYDIFNYNNNANSIVKKEINGKEYITSGLGFENKKMNERVDSIPFCRLLFEKLDDGTICVYLTNMYYNYVNGSITTISNNKIIHGYRGTVIQDEYIQEQLNSSSVYTYLDDRGRYDGDIFIENVKDDYSVLSINNGGNDDLDESLKEMLKRIAQMNLLKALIENYQRVKEERENQGGGAVKERTPVKEGNVPIKASSVKSSTTTNDQTGEEEKTYTGAVGWSVPDDQTTAQTIVNYYIYDHEGVYDDSLPYDYPYDDVGVADPSYPDERTRGATGVLSIPDENVHPKSGTNEIDRDAPVEGTAEATADPDDPDDPVDPEKPFNEIFENLPYVPQNMDLTQLFPFCIPFDIIYLFEKFQADRAEAPVLELVIPMPDNVGMGDGYHFTIDFQRFVVLRDIIYIFLLLGFILGLMKLTRGIIRG